MNPHFHEDFYFPVEKFKSLQNLVLRLSLFEFSRQNKHDAVGHALFPLAELKENEGTKKFELPLRSPSMVRTSVQLQ